MMRAFGDAPQPSRYSALIILNHIKSYLKCVIKLMEDELNDKSNKLTKKQRKTVAKHLEILQNWYPLQVKIFKKWKYFKFEAKTDKSEHKVPDLANEGEADNEESENDDDDEHKQSDKNV